MADSGKPRKRAIKKRDAKQEQNVLSKSVKSFDNHNPFSIESIISTQTKPNHQVESTEPNVYSLICNNSASNLQAWYYQINLFRMFSLQNQMYNKQF